MKVGDKVRVVDDMLGVAPEYVGQVGIVDLITSDGDYDYVVKHEDGKFLCWDFKELEVVDD